MRFTTALLFFLPLLAGCMEAQPAPERTQLTSEHFTIDIIAADFEMPLGLAALPGGAFLVSEKSGALYLIRGDERQAISGLPDDIFSKGQAGLIDITLAPDFNDSQEVFVTYAFGTSDANGTALFKARLSNTQLQGGKVIFRSDLRDTNAHYGGRLAFLPDETLILTVGEGFAYREEAQQLSTNLGKTLRLSRSGDPVPSNPFIAMPGAKAEVFSLGHRNPQGLAFDPETQTLWMHEHGPRGGDELNKIVSGANYGWPIATTGRDYNGARISPFEHYPNMADPFYDWVPSIAPSGMIVYNGDAFPEWRGDIFIGALAEQSLRRLDMEAGQVKQEIILLKDLKARFRDIDTDTDGNLVLLIENNETGFLLRLSPKKNRL